MKSELHTSAKTCAARGLFKDTHGYFYPTHLKVKGQEWPFSFAQIASPPIYGLYCFD